MANDSYQLVVRNAPQSGLAPGQVIALEDEVLTLGRDPLSDIILDDAEVSRHHARLVLQAGGYAIQDMGSTNGTFVDGKRLAGEPMALNPGQVIMLGSNVTLVYQAIAAVDPMATMVASAAADEPEEIVEEAPPVVEEVVEEVAAEVEVPSVALEPTEPEPEAIEEPSEVIIDEVVQEEVVDEEDEDFATMMDESPFPAPADEVEPEPEPEPLPELTPEPEPEPLPELPSEPPLPPFVEDEPVADVEPPPAPEPLGATFDDLDDDRTYIDSAAPVADFDETPVEPAAPELPPTPPPPPVPKFDEPEKKSSNRNIILIAVAAFLVICCCLALLIGGLAYFDVFSSF
ncbi:MAG: FHA domain-containing protein [Chloroflexota bacterium]